MLFKIEYYIRDEKELEYIKPRFVYFEIGKTDSKQISELLPMCYKAAKENANKNNYEFVDIIRIIHENEMIESK